MRPRWIAHWRASPVTTTAACAALCGTQGRRSPESIAPRLQLEVTQPVWVRPPPTWVGDRAGRSRSQDHLCDTLSEQSIASRCQKDRR